MGEESRGEGAIAVAVVGVMLVLIGLIGGGAALWFVVGNQRMAMERALVAEQRARAMADAAQAQAEAAQAAIEAEAAATAAAAAASTDTAVTDPAAEATPDVGPSELDQLRWIVGSWTHQQGDALTEEVWLAPRGGIMLGINRASQPAEGAFFEYLRIELNENGIAYVASPMGRNETAFPLKETGDHQVTFENLENDFPHRIIYRLEEDCLFARIEGTVDGKARSQEWKWTRTAN